MRVSQVETVSQLRARTQKTGERIAYWAQVCEVAGGEKRQNDFKAMIERAKNGGAKTFLLCTVLNAGLAEWFIHLRAEPWHFERHRQLPGLYKASAPTMIGEMEGLLQCVLFSANASSDCWTDVIRVRSL